MPLFCCYSDVELAANEMQELDWKIFFIVNLFSYKSNK